MAVPFRLSKGRLVVVAVLFMTVASGCGGGGSNPDVAAPTGPSESAATGSASGTKWPADKCSFASADDVGAAVGEPVEAEGFPPFGCQYTGTDSSSNTGSVVEYFTRSDECQNAEKADSGARVVEGLGAHAAFAAGNTDEVLAVTLDDGRCFFVHGTYTGESDTSRQAVAKVIVSAA